MGRVHKSIYTQIHKLHDDMKVTSESASFTIFNTKKCIEILNKSERTEDDLSDFIISLHLILESNLHALFRALSHTQLWKLSFTGIDELKIIERIDNIDFITKTTLFIYNSKFNFDNKIKEAEKHHKIIGILMNFSEMRNKLLHGHSNMTIIEEGKSRDSDLKKKLNMETLEKQIKMFITIVEGMRFYLDCLDSSLTTSRKESYKNEFLSDSFLTDTTFFKNMKAKKS